MVVSSLFLGSANCLLAQSLSADSFLNSVSAHPFDRQVEQDRYLAICDSLSTVSPAEVERILPAVLMHTRPGGDAHERLYAVGFLFDIAMRPDRAALLSATTEQVAALILDANLGVQRGALVAMDYVIGKAGTNNQPYLSALQTALQKPQTPQDAGEQMIGPLLTFGRRDPGALKSALAFLQRSDLTPSTRIDLVHHLGWVPGLPEEVNQYLVMRLDDTDPSVRAMAVVTYADSTTAYHAAAKDRVLRMANDPQENPQIRELAKDALAGKTHLNPNITLPPAKPVDR